MSQILQLFIVLPLLAFVASLLIPRKQERAISWLVVGTTSLHFAGCLAFIIYWIINDHPILDIKHITIYKSASLEFFIDFYFDTTTAVFATVGSLIILLASIFSKYYLHRDEGFKRFFNTLLLFFLGYNLVVFAGNFETLFIGWELLGFCSFLLIAFYRDRYLPVKNGLKVISVYRLGDVCLMLAMWMLHHLFHKNVTFLELTDDAFIGNYLPQYSSLFIFVAVMIVVAAAAKSAMLPFSSWLPRAMEGPTTSSAIFYGSLSVHLGAFLLIRTYHLWDGIMAIKILVVVIGLATSLIANAIARVQSTVKTQIAYSSITQIGLIFIEVALGFHTLALIHFAGNAFLRTYQLLVSPSVLSYEIHDMVFKYKPSTHKHSDGFFHKLKNTFYILSIKEWNIDKFLYQFLWSPFKWVGKSMSFLASRSAVALLAVIFVLGVSSYVFNESIPAHLEGSLPYIFGSVGLLLILRSFAERDDARRSWWLIIAAQCFITLSITIDDNVSFNEVLIYLSGIVVGALSGYACLNKIYQIDNDISLNHFHGYSYEKPRIAFVFLLSSLALIGFPFTPTFLGIDILFAHIHQDQPILIAITSLSFIFIEIAILRIYARVFLGQHKKNYHPIAYRSS
ncbi:MAG TPA: proton-conducting transporter membrane subunit [Segetibacter sp.]|jgi:NADH:ubiquinone oxidoreductase subunit 5 (subunit L)/multisubunit Na+/H+ antiporter MnhA subunit